MRTAVSVCSLRRLRSLPSAVLSPRLYTVVFLLCSLYARAQFDLDSVAARVHQFGTQLPQEKVFIHTDNSAYFLGDTIHYQAYVTRTDRGTLSTLSGVLYVELLNADGYLVERQIVRLRSGLGEGSIVLATGRSHYAGYYELRAYTRWMLNFGRTALRHNKESEQWFVRRHMAYEYYIDYDKIYSRTFPVYDEPMSAGEYYPDMTERPLQRLMSERKGDDEAVVTLYPEGGRLVSGTTNRLYFEAATVQGRHVRGTLVVRDKSGAELARAETEHRGKGVAEFVPQDGIAVEFQTSVPLKSRPTVPRIYNKGVVLSPRMGDDALEIRAACIGQLPESLYITVMHDGVICYHSPLQDRLQIPTAELPQGVLDVTAYDGEGRIWADRLVFNSHSIADNRLVVDGIDSEYAPFAPISLTVRRPDMPAKTVVSVSVTDADNSDMSTDNGTILTEMLLCSELRGFIEEPGYYFESDDDLHRRHLDLLCATQGWRRFSWSRQSRPDLFSVAELNEPRTPRLNGTVYKYEAIRKADELQEEIDAEFQAEIEENMKLPSQAPGKSEADTGYDDMLTMQGKDKESNAHGRYMKNPGNLKRDVTVHAEFVCPGDEPMFGDVMSDQSRFNIEQPEFFGQFYMHLAAQDTTRWSAPQKSKGTKAHKATHQWVLADESEYPEFYVRLSDPFPRHSHPYPFYRTTLASAIPDSDSMSESKSELNSNSKTDSKSEPFDDRVMQQVTIRAGRTGKRRFDSKHPAYAMTAYEAFNRVCDAGLCPGQFVGAERLAADVARLLAGDMGVNRAYKLSLRRDGLPASHTMSVDDRAAYDKLENLDSVLVYTDYAPRHYGNPVWDGANQPEVIVDMRRFSQKGRQMTYRDRFYIRQGFNVCEDFYSPDYSRAVPSAPTADVRRTLIWIPAAMLDTEGKLSLSGYNCGKSTHLRVTVNGIDTHGTPLSN